MLSKAKIKFLSSLKQKKFRDEENLFIAEGSKLVLEIINNNWSVKYLIATKNWLDENRQKFKTSTFEILEADIDEIKKISNLSTVPEALIVCQKKQSNLIHTNFADKLTLMLDGIQDPGNFGTLVRIADWFAIENIVCSQNTVDIYNPKTVQATMGSICRVNIFYTDLLQFILTVKLPVFGAFMDGQNIYTTDLPTQGIILLGSEGSGISNELNSKINYRISIPSFNKNAGPESLNVAVAGAIILSEFKRKTL